MGLQSQDLRHPGGSPRRQAAPAGPTGDTTFKDPEDALSKAFEVAVRAKELPVIFSTPNGFFRTASSEWTRMIENVVKRTGAAVRVLVPGDRDLASALEERKEIPILEFRAMGRELRTAMTIVVADRSRAIIVETKADYQETKLQALGRATNTENRHLAEAHSAAFEIIWKQAGAQTGAVTGPQGADFADCAPGR